jgi:putative polymerase
MHVANLVRPHSAWSDDRYLGKIAFALIFSAISFNAVLSAVNANLTPVSVTTVMLSEMLIIGAAVVVGYRSFNIGYLVLVGMIFYTLTLTVVRADISPEAGFDVKIVRDFTIPIVFFVLGLRINNLETADSIVFKATALLLCVALFEYFYLETYLKVFDVVRYYIARGSLEESEHALTVSKGLMISGIRPADQGRVLLPFLGEHRVSSLFLEPNSLGNYGCIVALWAIVRSRMARRFYFWSLMGAGALIILSDTRFDATFLVTLGLLMLIVPVNISTPMAFIMPLIAMSCPVLLAVINGDVSDQIAGFGLYFRLLYSGHVILDFDILNWLGVKVSRLQTFDAGYGYVISNAGIIGLGLFWWIFLSLKGANRYFYAFRNASVAYFAVLFCIAESQLTIKTAALHWFLMGAISVARSSGPEVYRGRTRGLMHRRRASVSLSGRDRDDAQMAQRGSQYLPAGSQCRQFRGDKSIWAAFLRHLVDRGLKGVQLIIFDACRGLIESAAEWPDKMCEAFWTVYHALAFKLDRVYRTQ